MFVFIKDILKIETLVLSKEIEVQLKQYYILLYQGKQIYKHSFTFGKI